MEASIWKNKDFVWLFIGRTCSQLGTSVTTFAIPWLLLELTGSATQTGIAFAIGFVPYLLLSLPAGVWADQYNRKLLMIISDTGRLLLLLSVALTYFIIGDIPIFLLFSIQAGISLFSAVFDAAYGACLPNILDRSMLQEGNSILQTGFSMSRIGGPVVAGFLISIVGAANTILIDVLSYAISIITIFFIHSSFSVSKTNSIKKSMFENIREGIQYVWSIKIIRILALFSMFVNLVGPGMDIALIYRVKNELSLASSWAGIIMAGLSCGMVVGSIVVSRFKNRFGLGTLITISTFGLAIPPFILALTTNPIILLFTQFIVGFMIVSWNIQTTTLRQSIIPDHLLGRSVSIFRLIVWVSVPLGGTAAGIITETWGAPAFFLFAGGVLSLILLISLFTKLNVTNETDNKTEVIS
ncbi:MULTISPECIES: MFS transporter [Bacillus cereus group]|uniref:MFS transporter n=1 Tax=Bacillus cereus group TaxID=86661 RepID=UPI001603791B|nr:MULTISPECIES: MFS transporter [Bacillus cereus group]MDF9530190.1 MFS transporter [Bacillus cereus]MDG1578403.1 MFS transporter [Bacillus cereus]